MSESESTDRPVWKLESDRMAFLFTTAAAAAFLLFPTVWASPTHLKPTDFKKISCGDEGNWSTLDLGLTLSAVVNEHRDQFHESLQSYDRNRHSYISGAEADGWQRFEYPFLDTVRERDEDGKWFAAKPFRLWKLVGQVRSGVEECEFADLAFERDWVSEISENVIDKCFRYYAAMAGNRSQEDIQLAIRLLKESQSGADSWWVRKIIEVRDDPWVKERSGSALGMAYGQHVIQCQSDMEQGKLLFRVPE